MGTLVIRWMVPKEYSAMSSGLGLAALAIAAATAAFVLIIHTNSTFVR